MSDRRSETPPGGFFGPKPATPEIQKIVDEVKPQLEEKENVTYEVFVAIEYMIQIVEGKNYLIKVSVNNSTDECVHLEVYVNLEGEIILTAYETGKTKCDPLTNSE
ncbi:cystatin-A-like [Pelodiscus sinensis]|uniref:cystatin-A-like n=1 Tax=Pelodiscus sinensis TaxID=13735 RepID=UPI003F6A6FD8